MKEIFTHSQGRLLRSLVLFLSNEGKDTVAEGLGIVVEAIVSAEWASLTFTGERHRVVLRLPAPATFRPDADAFSPGLPGAIVAVEKLAWTAAGAGARLTIDLLVIAGMPGT
jgi:hypothetical protein